MKHLSFLLVAMASATASGFLIRISENLPTTNCQEVLNNLEVCIQVVIFQDQDWFSNIAIMQIFHCLQPSS